MLNISKILILTSVALLSIPQTIYAQANPNAAVEASIRFYFADIPVMAEIAKCETNFKQYNLDGSAYYDSSGTYIGVFQFNKAIHAPKAQALGLDLATIDGNLMYARHLYDQSGTSPWKGCLPKAGAITNTTTTSVAITGDLTVNLRMGMSHPQILILQKLLNKNGFVIAQSGPGSAGSETNYFGALTRETVRRFQCAKQIVCSGNEATTGFGRVGPHTRSILNQLN